MVLVFRIVRRTFIGRTAIKLVTVLMTGKALLLACVTEVQRKTPLFLNAVIEEARGAN
jgi:hypothetical protein